ncbi:hypothetical protein EMPS_04789 [Entomortierella parvispora]|uniref:Uncharacterized protein n=1 Tax=Entomortierella parvispora TaxID=205924 RepID=A0A9P3H994_9FUNG|nr:hypothetical protein EMPS_04789 [Entomortierella parvispora]
MQRGSSTTKPGLWTSSQYEGSTTASSTNIQQSLCCEGCMRGYDELLQHGACQEEKYKHHSKDQGHFLVQRAELNQAIIKTEQDQLIIRHLLKECDFINPTRMVPQKAFQQFHKMDLYDMDRTLCRSRLEREHENLIRQRQDLKDKDIVLTTREWERVCRQARTENVCIGQQQDLKDEDTGRGPVQMYHWNGDVASKFAEKYPLPGLDRQIQEHQKSWQDSRDNNSLADQRKVFVIVVSIISMILFILIHFFPVESNPHQEKDRVFR